MVSVPSGVGPEGRGEDEMMPRGKLSVCRLGGFGWISSLGGGGEGWNLQAREGFGLAHAKNRPLTEGVFSSNELAVCSSSTVFDAVAG